MKTSRSDRKHVLRWALPTKKPKWFARMDESVPVPICTEDKREAAVFNSKREAIYHPAFIFPGCSFRAEPLVGESGD